MKHDSFQCMNVKIYFINTFGTILCIIKKSCGAYREYMSTNDTGGKEVFVILYRERFPFSEMRRNLIIGYMFYLKCAGYTHPIKSKDLK